eukprot:m.85950 g.85950  ORF g.85950 m.85950 type:complete len:52 (-) comp14753_c0_seq1:31-186(-)
MQQKQFLDSGGNAREVQATSVTVQIFPSIVAVQRMGQVLCGDSRLVTNDDG